jgi:hypothetical protein
MVACLTTIIESNHAKQSMGLSYDSDTDSFQHLNDNNTPSGDPWDSNSDPLLTNGNSSKCPTQYTNTNTSSPSFLNYLPCCSAPSPDTQTPSNKPEASTKVEVQTIYRTFILVSSLTPPITLTDKMEVEIASVSSSSSSFYYPSDTQLQIDEDSNHATKELSGDGSRKLTTLLPHTAVSAFITPQSQWQPHCWQANSQLLAVLSTIHTQVP